jgi:soluble lytic murein transglycosylase
MKTSAKLASVSLVLFLAPGLAQAAVRIEVGASGRKVIFNESTTQRARRFAGRLLPLPSVDLEPLISRHSLAQNLDPKLVRALIQVESGYNERALSNKGAMGLMQLIRGTADDLNVRDPYDPDENVRGGTTYLRQLLDRFLGRIELALAAYNAGPGAVEKHRGIPPYRETRDYVQRILTLYSGQQTQIPVTNAAYAASLPVAGTAASRIVRPKAIVVRGPNNRPLLTTTSDVVR